jgi:hypothetical protein
MISTRNLSALPTLEKLKSLTKSLAMLDAIICREWEYRYYSFNSRWATGEEMASMRNGQGDAWFCGFNADGAFLKGFDHESEMSPWKNESSEVWPGVLSSVPKEFKAFATEPAFSMSDTTFCIWRSTRDSRWNTGLINFPNGEDPDGSGWMLSILDGDPDTYKKWAEAYYDQPLSLTAVEQIYADTPLTESLVKQVSAEADLASVLADADEIGYPVAPGS